MSLNLERAAPVAAGVTMAVIFGLSFSFTKTALRTFAPLDLLALRFFLAALAMAVLAATGLIRLNLSGGRWRGLLPLAAFQPVAYFLCETAGIRSTPASEAGMIIGAIPVVVAVMAALFLGERPNIIQSLFIAAPSLGMIAMVAGSPRNGEKAHLAGLLFLFGAVLAASLYSVLSRRLSRDFTPVEATAVMMWTGAAVFGSLALGDHLLSGTGLPLRALAEPSVLGSLAYLGLLSSVAAFFLFNYMFRHLEAVRTVVYTNLTTVVSVFAGVLFLGERLDLQQWAGGGLILLGVWGTNRFGAKNALLPPQGDLSENRPVDGSA